MPAAPTIEALLHPFREGLLAHSADTLFMNARLHHGLPGLARRWTCVQGFKPEADALAREGLASTAALPADERTFAAVLLPLPPQRDRGRAQMVEALRRLAPGGHLVVAQANALGGRSAMQDLQRLAAPLAGDGKFHCRIAWTTADTQRVDEALEDAWLAAAAPRPVPGTPWLARPGVFARDRIDAGSALLAECLPADLAGAVADLGAGWGYLSTVLLQRCPGIRSLDVYEADAQALALAQANLDTIAHAATRRYHWQDVAGGLPAGFDVVVSNPPFHAGGTEDPELGRAFIAAAAASLRPGGRLFLVANRHLPYEAALAAGFAQVRELAQREGYKVIEARRAA